MATYRRTTGLSLALQQPEKFERLVPAGVDVLTDAVLTTEGLTPEDHKHLRCEVRAFVAKRFESWGRTAGGRLRVGKH